MVDNNRIKQQNRSKGKDFKRKEEEKIEIWVTKY